MTDEGGPRVPSLARALGERQLWILLGLVVFFFARPLFFGETFYFRDLTLLALPQRMRLVELVRSSGLPLWDPYLHGGQPFLANPSNVALYPTALLSFILTAVTAFNLEIVFHFLLCALAVYLLSRTLLLHAALAATLLALLLAVTRAGRRPWLATALAGLVVADLAVAGQQVNPFMPRASLAAEPAAAVLVRRHLAGGRLFRDATPASHELVAPSNEIVWRSLWRRETLDFYGGIAFGIPVIFHDDYDGLAQRRLVRMTSMITRLAWERRLPLLSAGNVTVIVAGEPLSVAGLELVAELPSHSNLPFYLYRNLTAAPRVGFVSTLAFVESETDAVRALLSRGFDPRHHVVIEGRAAPHRGGGCGTASVTDIERRPASWTGRVMAPCDGYLVFSEPFYPGWKGSVDGAATPVLRANLAFSAIAVPAGTHLVSKIYRPTSVSLGAALSVVSVLLAMVLGRALVSG